MTGGIRSSFSRSLNLASLCIRGTDFENPGQFRKFFLRFSTGALVRSFLHKLGVQTSGQTCLWLEQTEVRRME